MLIKTKGIIFRTRKYRETSLIVEIYTEAKGLQSYVVNGVRTRKARVNASLMQLMSLVDLVAYYRDDKDLHRIREIRPASVYQSIPFDLKKGAIGMFMVEVARKSIREVEENREMFNFLFESFLFLDRTKGPVANIHLRFLCGLSAYLGFMPVGEVSERFPYFDLQEGVFVASQPGHTHYLTEEQSKTLGALLESNLENCHTIRMPREQRRVLLNHLLDYYRLHIEQFSPVQSHQILEDILS